MMRRHCDRCDGTTGGNNADGLADGVVMFKLDSLRKDIIFAELCGECLNSLIEWMKPIMPKDKEILSPRQEEAKEDE